MQAGKLRHYVQWYSTTQARDSYGDSITSYSLVGNLWARIEPLAGRELMHAQQAFAEATYRITARYDSALSADVTDTIYWTSQTRRFEVLHIANADERNEYVVMLCKELF
jgi:SPP1 family predicted phage head-tail adaptor